MTAPGRFRPTRPDVPAAFAAWLEMPATAASGDAWPGFQEAAERALAHALHPEGRERRGAFDLLAADGYLTYGAEAALTTDDPSRHLHEMIGRTARGPRGSR
ncbi:MAG TPA: hypothetical protein VGA70_11455 [Longimicrobiales bacterium]|jgi:hypothetical protein